MTTKRILRGLAGRMKTDTVAALFARAIEQEHEIKALMESEGERELLRANDTELFYAYIWLLQTAYPDDKRWNS